MADVVQQSTAAGGAALAIVVLLTIPSFIDHIAHLKEPKSKASIYEDKDGVATAESMAKYSTTIPKILLTIFTTFGLLTATALAILATLQHDQYLMFVENWLNVASWVSTRDKQE